MKALKEMSVDELMDVMQDWLDKELGTELYHRLNYAEAAIAAERERCAKIAEAHPGVCQTGCDTGEEIAAKIRAGAAKTLPEREESAPTEPKAIII